ncbi:AraC family transcriptional regulator [Lentzea sp. BCCO 10_0856]|uniref:AraC family transcriptional regulator n=1 Tax=Lentzea miocenica TaxID=3095431 RepID=A0ABU4SRP9_9PSEU|nr:AraC family transcriptional regulator [Lentzea sp. BCCO 10_0856]MDX8028575.1 AraC family transcriptional regulator [Lentzea sp. BCCO 10_0856]
MTDAALPETCCPRERATIWIWPGQAAYLGPSLDLDPHSGSVHCFALGVDAPFLLRCGGDERKVRSALIPARTRHQVVSDGGRMLFLYLEPDLSDDRIRTALGILLAHPCLSAPQVAAELSLSTSRFLHLFSAQAGTSFRRYRLWARMLRVAAATAGGADLTRASVEAGFASPSHFSDSFHDMFGLTASTLLGKNARVVLDSGSNGAPAA